MGLGFVLLAGGCTFLVSFDDEPAPQVDASDAQVVPDTNVPDVLTDPIAPPPDRVVPVTPACDTSFPLNEIEGCATFVEGSEVCADSAGLTAYPGDRSTDLVACSKTQGATCVRHCIACAHLPSGFPDQCDQCVDKDDGKYCGTEMGWQPIHFRLLVTCANHRVVSAAPCSTACDSNGSTGAALCAP